MTPIEASKGRMPDLQSQTSFESHRVVVFGHLDDPTVLKEILTEVAGIRADDAMAAARMAPGVLPGGLSEQTAQTVASRIVRSGINAIALPESEIPRLEHVEVVHHARCEPEGLTVIDLHGADERRIPWPDVALVSAGCVPVEAAPRLSAEPAVVLHAAPNPHPASPTRGPRSVMLLWLIVDRPWKAYRLIHNQMNYEYLGARKTSSAMQNFSMFLEEVLQNAPGAYVTPATRAFLHGVLHRHFEFHSADELRRDTILHLLVMRHLLSRRAECSPGALAVKP